jgi:putative aldouronate transport system substrate-binding protein
MCHRLKGYSILSLIIVICILAGCSDGTIENNTQLPVTITTVEVVGHEVHFKNDETIDNNIHMKWARETFNIQFKVAWSVPVDDNRYETKIRQMLVSNQPFPDVMRVSDPKLIRDLISSGGFMDLTDVIDQYASPRLKQLYDAYPEAKGPISFDGRLYGIPVLSGGNVSDSVMWIRRDWLQRLGLSVPRTIAELERTMYDFVHRDPDRNGRDDTIGLALSIENGIVNEMGDGSFLLGAYGANAGDGQWGTDSKGNLQYGGIQPEMKQSLGTLSEWYKSGFLDDEVAMLDGREAVQSFVNGVSGIVFGSPEMIDWPFSDLWSLIPEADPQPYPVPAGADGSIGRLGTPHFAAAILVNKDFQHIEQYMQYLDAIYGWYYGDERFRYGFAEGYDYRMVKGEPLYGDLKRETERVNPVDYFIGLHNDVHIPYLQYSTYQKLRDGGKPSGIIEERIANDDPLRQAAGAIVADQNQYRMDNLYFGPPTPAMQTHGEYLEWIERSTYANIVYGKQPLDSFDRFVEDWKKNGGNTITEEVNLWRQDSEE